MKIAVRDLLKELVALSEKSAAISRIFRLESKGLFEELIQEKTGSGKNPRFIHDYKTFADVLIQQMAAYHLETKFPGLADRVYGEESNEFENSKGERLSIRVGSDPGETYGILIKILRNDTVTADKIIQVIYATNICDDIFAYGADHELQMEPEEIGVWIDPIDSTSEYIKGQWHIGQGDLDGHMAAKGLHCVTCLFGVFDTKTGIPVLGVINQPFFERGADNSSSYRSRYIWGFNIDHHCMNNVPTVPQNGSDAGIILIGGRESTELKEKLSRISRPMYVAGAGHKLLNVVLGRADLLMTAAKSTYFWDTCAAHAVLRSIGGGIIPFEKFLELPDSGGFDRLEELQIKYKEKTEYVKNSECNNSHGLIAYRSVDKLKKAIAFLKQQQCC